jgi:hypothetical protein
MNNQMKFGLFIMIILITCFVQVTQFASKDQYISTSSRLLYICRLQWIKSLISGKKPTGTPMFLKHYSFIIPTGSEFGNRGGKEGREEREGNGRRSKKGSLIFLEFFRDCLRCLSTVLHCHNNAYIHFHPCNPWYAAEKVVLE